MKKRVKILVASVLFCAMGYVGLYNSRKDDHVGSRKFMQSECGGIEHKMKEEQVDGYIVVVITMGIVCW